VFLTCYQVLAALADVRAPAILTQGEQWLLARAQTFASVEARRLLWENHATRRVIAAQLSIRLFQPTGLANR